MGKINKEVFRGKEIVVGDFRGISIREKDLIKNTLEQGKKTIAGYPHKSALVLTDVTGTGFDREVADMFKEYASHNTPYVKASALVGITGLQRVVLKTVESFTGRKYNMFESAEAAREWLSQQ